jgi:hypothetical protein
MNRQKEIKQSHHDSIKKLKYLGINLSKELKDLYTKRPLNYKLTLRKAIKKIERLPMFMDGQI